MALEEFGGLLVKAGLFVLVQALVYLILSSSSTVFSHEKTGGNALGGFRRSRSVSVRRMLAALSDMPPGGEPSPSSAAALPPIMETQPHHGPE